MVPNPRLKHFSKLTCFSTLFLIFVGSLVTSTGSGLAVPDWPLSYGTLFPPMVGGIFYEHGHRMVASVVGLFMLILAVWLGRVEKRKWVRGLGFTALGAVIVQGLLGGITVLFFLPTAVSVSHGILAQTFFLLTIFIAYSQSTERVNRSSESSMISSAPIKAAVLFVSVVYIQLVIGAVMRHLHAGLAIPDFPTMGGYWLPPFNEQMLAGINAWRFQMNLDPVTLTQVIIHFAHRLGALAVLIAIVFLNIQVFRQKNLRREIFYSLWLLDLLAVAQIALGIMTVLSIRQHLVTSFHVVTGAAILGMGFLFLLRISPLRFSEFRTKLQ